MRSVPSVKCPPSVVGTPQQVVKLKRGGPGKSGSGPSGWKLRPSAVLARSLAELRRGRK